MRTILALAIVILASWPAFAQEEETLISGEIVHGGFGGPVVKFGSLNGETGLLVGARGGWIINHVFSLGAGGYGLVNNVNAMTLGPNGERYLAFGYGGLELEYIPRSDKLIHVSFMTLIGAGGVGWRNDIGRTTFDGESDAFFIVEPAADATLNVTPFFRISAGVSYRYITGLNSAASTNADLAGPSGTLTLRFGKF